MVDGAGTRALVSRDLRPRAVTATYVLVGRAGVCVAAIIGGASRLKGPSARASRLFLRRGQLRLCVDVGAVLVLSGLEGLVLIVTVGVGVHGLGDRCEAQSQSE